MGGQILTARTGLELTQKLKQKNSKKGDFLILFLIDNFSNLLKKKTPHPNPLPASGERGLRRRFFLKGKLKNPPDLFLRFFIYHKKLIHRIPSPHLWGEG